MTPAERKLAAYLLREASGAFADRGCNDFDFPKGKFTPEEEAELTAKYKIPDAPGAVLMDWFVMDRMAATIESDD